MDDFFKKGYYFFKSDCDERNEFDENKIVQIIENEIKNGWVGVKYLKKDEKFGCDIHDLRVIELSIELIEKYNFNIIEELNNISVYEYKNIRIYYWKKNKVFSEKNPIHFLKFENDLEIMFKKINRIYDLNELIRFSKSTLKVL